MNFPHFFIDRPIFAGVISIVITLVGAIALLTLPIAQYPEIAPPTIQVTANYPGANAKVVSETVATPIEQQVNGVENMLYMSSQSTSDGNMTLSITFKLGTNLDTAQVLVQNRVAIAIPVLPPEVQRIGVTTKKQSPDITMVVHLVSPDGSLDQLFTSNYALLQIRDELARLDGVGDINVFGAREYSMRIWLDPNKIAARDLTAQDVVQAIQEQNVQVAAGIIGAPPVPKGATAFQYTVSTQGRLTDEKEFGEIIVKTGADGQVTRVRDVARVELAARDYTVNSQLGGKPATAIAIFQLPGSNALATSDAVREKMAELKQRFPVGPRLHNCLRPDGLRARVDPRSAEDALRSDRACRSRRACFSPNLARGAHPAHRHSGFAHRHFRGDVGFRILDQQHLAFRPRPRDRHRGR